MSGIGYKEILVALHPDIILKTTLSVTVIYVSANVAVTVTLCFPTSEVELQFNMNTIPNSL